MTNEIMKDLDAKINAEFAGRVVRKDLTHQVKGNASVPTYVLEYLLGQYCATDDTETIANGIKTVRSIISEHFVHRDEANVIKATIKEKGSHRIIDKLSVKLNDREDRYEAYFSNLDLNRIPISGQFTKDHPKLLSEGVWCIVNMEYQVLEEHGQLPWIIESLKPIQISSIDIEEFKNIRSSFTKEEWIDLMMQSIGLNPEEFGDRSKLLQLARLVPFAEKNYNLIELGPKGTGKSHIYSELSPHGILLSGGEVSKAKLFVNNSSGEIGLVGYWDVVAYDEFAGKAKKVDRGLVDIMKNYMANKSFSRGATVHHAEASMVFVGNTDHSVPYMLKHSDLFEALPKDYYDTAFLDRVHAYLPGWEVKKLRNEMFSGDYGFIVDYLAEVLKYLRREDRTKDYQKFFTLSNTITTRDKTAIEKTFSGLVKVIYPNGEFTEDEGRELMDFAIESRKRVKDQLSKMDETFNDEEVEFEYQDNAGVKFQIECLELLDFKEKTRNNSEIQSDSDSGSSGHGSPRVELGVGHWVIRENQTGLDYAGLFGDYLIGATHIVVRDPYIRMAHQKRNFMELCHLILKQKPVEIEVKIHLITNQIDEYREKSIEEFSLVMDSLENEGLILTYEFDESLHDRSIELDNGWKIILGRGLDIWQKTGGYNDIAEFDQKRRLCKAFDITILSN